MKTISKCFPLVFSIVAAAATARSATITEFPISGNFLAGGGNVSIHFGGDDFTVSGHTEGLLGVGNCPTDTPCAVGFLLGIAANPFFDAHHNAASSFNGVTAGFTDIRLLFSGETSFAPAPEGTNTALSIPLTISGTVTGFESGAAGRSPLYSFAIDAHGTLNTTALYTGETQVFVHNGAIDFAGTAAQIPEPATFGIAGVVLVAFVAAEQSRRRARQRTRRRCSEA